MPLASPIRLTVAPGTAQERVIVEWDDLIEALPCNPEDASVQTDNFIGAGWAGLAGTGNAAGSIGIERQAQHAGPAQAVNAMLDASIDDAAYAQGLRIDLANPLLDASTPNRERLLATIYYPDAAMTSATHGLDSADPTRTRHVWDFAVGLPTATIAPTLPPVTDLVTVSVTPGDGAGIVEHSGQKWLRVAVRMPDEFTGNAADGWWDAAEARHIALQWSDDLQTWVSGQFIQAPGVADVVAGGTRTTWADSKHPQDAGELTSDMRLTWSEPPMHMQWSYSQDLHQLIVAGASLALPGFPYALPADAAALQADLRAAGFAGATVTTDGTAQVWEIILPDVETTDYQHAPVGTVDPGFSYVNFFGNEEWTTVLQGRYENPRYGPGLDPFDIHKRQFARGRVTRP